MKWERIGIIYRNLGLYEEAAATLKTEIESRVPQLKDYEQLFPNKFRVVCFKVNVLIFHRTILYFSQKQLPRKMKSRLVIRKCAGYIFWQLFFCGDYKYATASYTSSSILLFSLSKIYNCQKYITAKGEPHLYS